MATETEKLRSALRICAAALQAACQPGRPLRESDTIIDGAGTKMTIAQILDAADAALGEDMSVRSPLAAREGQ